jgi:2-polyprenyl-3-methyl-5-hydroxy-6-metoxy-1,4-benzoquinol methylase
MKRLVKRIPGAVILYRHLSFLRQVARDRYFSNIKEMNDVSHLKREWDFNSPIEQDRHGLVLSLVQQHVPDLKLMKVLEVGCSSGIFTVRLARSCVSVTALDVSPLALALATDNCRNFNNVVFRELDLADDEIPGRYDILFAMDVLDFMHGREMLERVVTKFENALRSDGILAFSSCRLPAYLRGAFWMRWLPEGADAHVEFIASRSGFDLLHAESHPKEGECPEGYIEHVVALFRKSGSGIQSRELR